jgi:hypothetical protein
MTLAPSPFHNNTADRIVDLLDALGDTADGIAERLAEAGITGQRGEAVSCPIARYLSRVEPDIEYIAVFGTVIEIDTTYGDSATLACPDAIHEFVTRFDAEHYPHLYLCAEATR